MQVGKAARAIKPELSSIYRAVTDGTNETLQSCHLRRLAIEMKECNDSAQRDFDSREISTKIASATADNMSRRLG